MVTRRSSRKQDKKLREREDLVRRAPDLSDGAKVLWIELLRGWAWDDLSCCPSQEALAIALGWSVRRVKRRLAELVGFELIKVTRSETHKRNTYEIATRIPEAVCHPLRLINKTLKDMKNSSQGAELSPLILVDKGTPPSPTWGRNCPVLPVSGDETVPKQGTELAPKDESLEDETKEEDETKRVLSHTHGSHGSSCMLQCPSGTNEGRTQDPFLEEGPEDFLSLSLVTDPPTKRASPRKRRSPDKSLTGIASSLHKGPVSPAASAQYVEASPPPPETPNDILNLLRSEIAAKYGDEVSAPCGMALSGKERGQLKSGILAKYAPDVILAMIRVLVWDWEVVRSVCWPPRKESVLPDINHLVIYRIPLSGATTTGFDYTSIKRGAHTSYANRYLNQGGPITPPCDDPF